MTTDLTTFAQDVKAACKLVPAAGRSGNKVFIHAAWAIGRFDETLAEFKADLVEANRARTLNLSRCDLVEHFDAYDVSRSEVKHLGATFNFITL